MHCVALGFIVSGLLLSGRSGVQIPFGAPQAMPKAFVFKGFRFFIFVKNEKNEKAAVFHWLFFRLLTEFMTDVVRLSGVRLANE